MPDLLVRDLPIETKREIEALARQHGQSLAAEARFLIQRGLRAEREADAARRGDRPGIGTQLAELAATLEPDDWTEALLPTRDEPHRPPPDFG